MEERPVNEQEKKVANARREQVETLRGLLDEGINPFQNMLNGNEPPENANGFYYSQRNAHILEATSIMRGYESNVWITEKQAFNMGYEAQGEAITLTGYKKDTNELPGSAYLYQVYNANQLSPEPVVKGLEPEPQYEKIDSYLDQNNIPKPEEHTPQAYSDVMKQTVLDSIGNSQDFMRNAEDSLSLQSLRMTMAMAELSSKTGIPISTEITPEMMKDWSHSLNTKHNGLREYDTATQQVSKLIDGITESIGIETRQTDRVIQESPEKQKEREGQSAQVDLSEFVGKEVSITPKEGNGKGFKGTLAGFNQANGNPIIEQIRHAGLGYLHEAPKKGQEQEPRKSISLNDLENGMNVTFTFKDKDRQKNHSGYNTGKISDIEVNPETGAKTGRFTMQREAHSKYYTVSPTTKTKEQENDGKVQFIQKSDLENNIGKKATVHFNDKSKPSIEGEIMSVGTEEYTPKSGPNQGKTQEYKVLTLDTGKKDAEQKVIGTKIFTTSISSITEGTPLRDAHEQATAILSGLGTEAGKVLETRPGFAYDGPFVGESKDGKIFFQEVPSKTEQGKTNVIKHSARDFDKEGDSYKDKGEKKMIRENIKENRDKGKDEKMPVKAQYGKDGKVSEVSQSQTKSQEKDKEKKRESNGNSR